MKVLATNAAELGIALTSHQLDQFEVYFRELVDWNQRMNLTAIIQYHEVQVKHFLDSLTVLLATGGLASGTSIMDVGAGAGFPGLPLKLVYPRVYLAMSDSVKKKNVFLQHLVAALGLSGVDIYTGRAEELARKPELREKFDLVVSRGVAKMPALLEYTLPFCRIGALAVTLKHTDIEKELACAGGALKTLGGAPPRVLPVRVTGLTDQRVVVAVEKTRGTPPQYPRRPGVPAKQPL